MYRSKLILSNLSHSTLNCSTDIYKSLKSFKSVKSFRNMATTRNLNQICVLPLNNWRRDAIITGIKDVGSEISSESECSGLIWTDPKDVEELDKILNNNSNISWVQLPFAGVEPFVDLMKNKNHLIWSCGKGTYAKPVAEMAFAMALSGFRGLSSYIRDQANCWGRPIGRNLFNANVTILGGGGITQELIPMLQPFSCNITVVRRSNENMEGVNKVVLVDKLDEILPTTDLLILALALTSETVGIIGKKQLSLLPSDAWIVNVARGQHIDTQALVTALTEGSIGGAGLDVTDPEPLPADHPLWTMNNVIISPHVGNTPEMGIPLLVNRVKENVVRWRAEQTLVGLVDTEAGY